MSILTNGEEFQKNYMEPQNANQRKPIVLVPGVLGSRLQAKLNMTISPGYFCPKISDWFDIWLNLHELFILYIKCWVYEISLRFDNGAQNPTNQTGVEIRTEDFGGTTAFEYLDSDHEAPGSPYFSNMVDYLVGLGYKRHDDLKGAPYDWRVTPSIDESFLANLKTLVEENYYQHFNRKVVILGHSMGNMLIYYFLKHQPQEWKDKFIDSFISINSPYIGSVKALKALTSGETEGHNIFISRLEMREASRTFPSSYLLLPRPSLWPQNHSVVVSTLTRNYTVHDYKTLFDTIGCNNCWERFQSFGAELGDLSAPNVEVHCVYSSGLPTAEVLMYDPDLFPDGTPVLKNGNGDGTVNTFSSSYCLNWRTQQTQTVHDVLLPGNDHVGMLSNKTLLNYIGKVTTEPSLSKHLKFDIL